MDEHGAATPRDSRPAVVVELDDQVVEVIGSPKAVPGILGVARNRTIVPAISRVLDPRIV